MADHEAESGLLDADERCDYFSADVVTKRGRERADGWRCGESASRPHNHTLYSEDGERVLYSSSWAQPIAPPATEGGERRG